MFRLLTSTYIYDEKKDALIAFNQFIKKYNNDIERISFHYHSGDDYMAPDGYRVHIKFTTYERAKQHKQEFKGIR